MDSYLIASLLVLAAAVLAVLVWIGLNLKDRNYNERERTQFIRGEIEVLRQTFQDSITGNMALVSQRLSEVSAEVAKQLASVNTQLSASTGQLNERLDNAARVVSDVTRGLGELSKATEQVFDVGKDIASLQEILKAPKLRGQIGEFFLGDLLSQILPSSHYELQYAFRDGTKVDAVIKLSGGMVPVDSKFSLENFQRIIDSKTEEEKRAAKRNFIKDVKNRIDEIAASYILPDEGTFEFALMYIPAENVYYETIIKDELLDDGRQLAAYAFSKRVIAVSPNSFYAYLQTILFGLRGLEISHQAKEIFARLEGLKIEFEKFMDDFDVVGKHITNTKNRYDDALTKIVRLGEKLASVGSIKVEELDPPTAAAKKEFGP